MSKTWQIYGHYRISITQENSILRYQIRGVIPLSLPISTYWIFCLFICRARRERSPSLPSGFVNHITDLQSQKAVSAYVYSKQILPFGFVRAYGDTGLLTLTARE